MHFTNLHKKEVSEIFRWIEREPSFRLTCKLFAS